MTNRTISALTAATTPLAGTETLPVFQGATTVKITRDQLFTPAAAKGINFTANTPAAGMTSQLLNWYEEGTWTPVISADGNGTSTFTATTATGKYTRIGRQVTVTCLYIYSDKGAVVNSYAFMGGLPFTIANDSLYNIAAVQIAQTAFDTNAYQVMTLGNSTVMAFRYNNGSGTVYAGVGYMRGSSFPASGTVMFTLTYFI